MITNKLNKHIVFLLFIVIVKTISPWSIINLGGISSFWAINSIVLFYIFSIKKRFYDTTNKRFDTIIFVFLIWNISAMVRGCFVAENYWEWKNLITMSFVFLLPLTIYFSTHREMVQSIFNMYMKYMLPAFFLFILVMNEVAYGVYLIPVSFMLLFLPLLSQKWKIVMLAFTMIVILSSIEARSNVIKFVIALGFGMLYYLRPFVNEKILRITRLFLLGLPFVLFTLAVSGTFNIFNISEYTEGEYTTNNTLGDEEDLTADTRTELYVEVIGSAIKNEYVWFGRTYARGNDSVLFGEKIEALTGTGKFERYSNEVSLLNIFTWTGLIGVILYFIIFIRASYLALYKSKSWFMKIIAVYVCFRWTYAWVEDFSRFDLSYICLWILIGMCYSLSFRSMTDGEFKYWVCGIFDIRYRKATLKKVRAIKQS
ncbi:hypothetical protein EYD46_00855 [Hyunsoonleella pacifica]|uniref:O-antigen ligase domain-containing protein n=2 Tax=Hyunsoonleella pacifica TaxID=1080224 RepID=A0A4Q9FRV9_9FLAO|nr:hypothetical protein EYD46_00855 [Hyunsoonleella pacifica]